ncbi:MAG: class I SAM-dependent methyltransferase [Daejeonella sp.]
MTKKDIYGLALSDFYYQQNPAKLWLHNTYGKPEDMPVDVFFRDKNEMPDLELYALSECKGDVLDIGAGVGSHALILQKQNIPVTALEISPLACQIMEERGVKNILNMDVIDYSGKKFDTVLMLMNGIGLTRTIEGLKKFLTFAKSLIKPNGQLLFDSSDISYLYSENENPQTKYYGEISYQYEYKGDKGDWFDWLYIDYPLLKKIANELGYKSRLLFEDDLDQYLVSLTLAN